MGAFCILEQHVNLRICLKWEMEDRWRLLQWFRNKVILNLNYSGKRNRRHVCTPQKWEEWYRIERKVKVSIRLRTSETGVCSRDKL